MLCTGAGNTAGKDLGTLGNELSELGYILVVDHVDLVRTEDANLLLSVIGAERTRIVVVSLHGKNQNLSDSQIPKESSSREPGQRGHRTVFLLRRGDCRRL